MRLKEPFEALRPISESHFVMHTALFVGSMLIPVLSSEDATKADDRYTDWERREHDVILFLRWGHLAAAVYSIIEHIYTSCFGSGSIGEKMHTS